MGRPRTGIGTPVMVRLQPAQLAALDAWIAQRDPAPTRPEAIRAILNDHLGPDPEPHASAVKARG